MLSVFLREILNWRYSEFLDKVSSGEYTSNEQAIFKLIEAIFNGKLPAIKEAIARIDGNVEQPVEILYPKFYTLYPNAKSSLEGTVEDDLPAVIEKKDPIDMELAGIRDTIREMGECPIGVVEMLIARETEIPKEMKAGILQKPDPMIKSLIAAHMFMLVQKGNYQAITELLNQIEGKVVEKIKLMGDDLYMTCFDEVAPIGAKLNENGVYQIENKQVTNLWTENLAKSLNK